jgi:hypothetical protein
MSFDLISENGIGTAQAAMQSSAIRAEPQLFWPAG